MAVAVAELTVPTLSVGLVIVGVAVIGRFGMMLILARRHYRQRNKRRFSWGPTVTRPVSVIVPAYNEKECIANTLKSLAQSTHPIEIIVVDDGSTDGTSEISREAARELGMTNVRVIRQENAGKPAALNNGVRNASYDIVVMMDGDTVFEADTVRQLVQPFADPEVGAVAGNAKVGNRDTIIGAWQHIEYVMGFNLDRRMYDLLRCMPTIPGAIGAFRREAVLQVGGMSEDTLAEDTDITIAMHREGWRVVYQEHARAWTEAPGSLKQLWSQRYRWSYGTMQALWKHRKSLTDKGPSGRFGRVGMPLVVIFQIVTPVFAPLIDVFTVYSMIFVDFQAALLRLARGPGRPAGVRGVRLPAGQGEVPLSADDAAPAAGLPPDDVPRPHPLLHHRPHRRPAALAEAEADRRGRHPGGGGLMSWGDSRGTSSSRYGTRQQYRQGYDQEYGRSSTSSSRIRSSRTSSSRIQQQPYPQQPYPQEYVAYHGGAGDATAAAGGGAEPEPPVPEAPADAEAEEEKPPPRPPGRDRYFDTLRAVALIRVVTYHTFGWAWCRHGLPLHGDHVRPGRHADGEVPGAARRSRWSGAGSAGCCRRSGSGASSWSSRCWSTTGCRAGRSSTGSCRSAIRRATQWGEQAWEILWYLRTYLWFVLLSPLLLKVFRLGPGAGPAAVPGARSWSSTSSGSRRTTASAAR